MTSTTKVDLRCKTPKCILSYPHLFKAQPGQNGGKDKFSAALVITREERDTPEFRDMKEKAMLAAREKFGARTDDLIRKGKLKMPFRDDMDDKGYPEGSIVVNARSDSKPGIVDRYKDPNTGKAREITDEKEVYPGMIVRASLRAFAYDTNGNMGVAFALNNVQKLGDGARLDGKKAAQDDFEALDEAPADLADLMN